MVDDACRDNFVVMMVFIRIKNDRDAIILDQLLLSRSHALFLICLQGTTELTEKGARKVAKCVRSMVARPVVRVEVASHMSDFAFVFSVAKILYLKGNRPELYVNNENHPISGMFNDSCLQLQQNHQALEEYFFGSSSSKTASIQLGISLHGNTALKTLTLQYQRNFTLDHARALATGICNSALTTLIIRDDYRLNSPRFDEESLNVIWQEGVQASNRNWKSLQIKLLGQRLDSTTSKLANILSCVESLTLQNVDIGLPDDKSQFQSLCEGLGRTSNLLGLTLEHCRLDDDATRMLATRLQNHRSMTTLNLAGNLIGDVGIAAFVENWPEDSNLESLDVSRNSMTSGGLQQLMAALPNRRSMKILNLSRNKFGSDGLEMIGNHLPNLRLQEMDLRNLSMSNPVASTRAMQSLVRGIKDNYFLEHLDIDCSRVLEHEINFYTKLNKSGRHLLIANDVPPTLWCSIFAKYRIERDEFSLSMIFYFLVEQPLLVNERQGGKRRKRRTTNTQPTKRCSARLRTSKG
jgi:hypothetical protein